ncbi:hypothetical protein HSBAA_44810 [Vreelandella sulfidaeris]|uniref:GST N-terminal domain-containing protein n=1 Tax=Vreelandella sulfidaeris TaxID=115553 RepID=A0A455UAX1_9GAMM|nr:hypothetical protein HSBAA_44810 [Halomonas sulfidaeris]
MELYLNATSPYARLVRIVLLEKGLADAVTLKWCDPWADDADLLKANRRAHSRAGNGGRAPRLANPC